MATRDVLETLASTECSEAPCETCLPRFPEQNRLGEAFARLGVLPAPLGKTDFFQWVKFTLENPDEIWVLDRFDDHKMYHYVTYVGEPGTVPAFVVEVRWLDEFTELTDYSMIVRDADLQPIRSSDLVYCLSRELERENLIRKLNEKALKKYDEDCLLEAVEIIDLAIRLSGSGSAYLFNNRGLIQWKMGRIERAKQDFLESIRLEEENGDPYFNLGLIYFDDANHDLALKYLRQAVRLNPSDSQFLTELGHLYLEMEREQEALHFFDQAVETNPEDAQVDFHLGYYFLYKKKDPRKALKYYDNGLRKDPEDQFALADMAIAHWALGNKRKTMGIRRVLEQHQRLLPYTVSRLVYLNTELGDYERALKYYREALTQNEPFEPEWLHYNAALVYAKTGRPRKALDTLSLAIRVGGEAVKRRARSDEALKELKQLAAFKRIVGPSTKRRTK